MSYSVSAALLADSTCDFTGDYWDKGEYDTLVEAYEAYNGWMPPAEEVRRACEKNGPDVYTLHVGIWDGEGNEIELLVDGV